MQISHSTIRDIAEAICEENAAELKSVKVDQKDDEISLEIYMLAKYGVKIPAIAWDIQEDLKRVLEMTEGLKLKSANIHVTGVKR